MSKTSNSNWESYRQAHRRAERDLLVASLLLALVNA